MTSAKLRHSIDIMKCPNILKPSAAFVVTIIFYALFLAPCCLADAIDAEVLAQDLLVPFNDLLPPLSEAEFETTRTSSTTTSKPTTTTTTTTTTKAPKILTTTTRPLAPPAPKKPTKTATAQQLKKTQYQFEKQQKLPAAPALDLNPEVAPPLETVPVTSIKVVEPKQAAASTQHLQHVQAAQRQYQTLQKQLQPQKQQQQKQQLQLKEQQIAKQLLQRPPVAHQLKPQATSAITKVPDTPQRQGNVEQLHQYLEYVYHPTTRRPARGALPTLTPFPRHFK